MNFDLQVQTALCKEWCNITVLIVAEPGSGIRHAVHIVHRRNRQKRLEQLVHDFVASEIELEREESEGVLSEMATTKTVNLTAREAEILRLVASGVKTRVIADQLYISHVTVNNHIKHVLDKLGAHSRLEAVLRAREAGLI